MTAKTTMAVVTATGILLSGAVSAQEQQAQEQRAQGDVAAADERDVETMEAGSHRASDLIGTTVVDSSGEEVGTIDDLVVSMQGRIEAVLSIGGIAGIGDRLIAVPIEDLEVMSAASADDDAQPQVRIDMSARELMEANAEFEYDLRAAR